MKAGPEPDDGLLNVEDFGIAEVSLLSGLRMDLRLRLTRVVVDAHLGRPLLKLRDDLTPLW